MIELLETPTFVVDSLFDCKSIRLFNYLEFENIPYEVLELCSSELAYRQGAYYPIIINNPEDGYELFNNINPRALSMAQEQNLILVFIYIGHNNLSLLTADTLFEQLISHHIDFSNIRLISDVKPIAVTPSYIYFPFAEMEAYLQAQDEEFVDAFVEADRDRSFSINVVDDTAHARLFCASIWYHALNEFSYMNYPSATARAEIIESSIYKWHKHWSATETLIDMFGQQLPVIDQPAQKLDFYNNSYWNFSIMPSFSTYNLSLSQNIFLPILNLQPFVIVGPPESLRLLRSLGYKTFKKHVNESYDTTVDNESRMQSLFRLVYEMAHFTGEELAVLNEKLRAVVNHNQAHFLSSKKFKLITLLNSLKSIS